MSGDKYKIDFNKQWQAAPLLERKSYLSYQRARHYYPYPAEYSWKPLQQRWASSREIEREKEKRERKKNEGEKKRRESIM